MTTTSGVPHRRLRDTAWLSVLPLVLNLVSVAANGFIIRRLGEDGYGAVVVALGLTGTAVLLANLGMRALYIKAVAGATDREVEDLMSEQMGLRCALAGLGGLAAIAAARLIYPDDRITLLCTVLQSIGLVLSITWTVMADVQNARERFRENALIGFWAGLALTATSVIVAAFSANPVAVSGAYLVGPAVSLFLQRRAMVEMGLAVRLGGVEPQRYRRLLHDARLLAGNDVLSVVRDRLESIWAPMVFGKALLGIHAAGMLVAERSSQIPDAAATAYFPTIAARHRHGDPDGVSAAASQVVTLALLLGAVLGVFTWFGAPYVASLLFPSVDQLPSRELATYVTRWSAIAIPLGALTIVFRYSLQAVGEHNANAKDQMLATVVGASMALGLALALGIRGLVIGVVAKQLMSFAFQSRTYWRIFHGATRSVPFMRLGMLIGAQIGIMGLAVGGSGTVPLLSAIVAGLITAGVMAFMSLRLGLLARPG